MSFYSMAFMGTAPFGSLLAGGLTDLFGVTVTLIIGGISCILGGIFFIGKLRVLRQEKS
jgi:predicted MFS family arabinose efflux permease